jgi:hypothetical protein
MRADRAAPWNCIGEHAGPKGMPSFETFEGAGNPPEESEMSAQNERTALDIVPPPLALLDALKPGSDQNALPGPPSLLHWGMTPAFAHVHSTASPGATPSSAMTNGGAT